MPRTALFSPKLNTCKPDMNSKVPGSSPGGVTDDFSFFHIPLSQVCRQRRLLWFGHVVREGEESSSFQALLMSINTTDIRRPRGRPRLRWIDVVKKDLQCINLSLLDAVQSASDRAAWLEIVNRCVDLMQ